MWAPSIITALVLGNLHVASAQNSSTPLVEPTTFSPPSYPSPWGSGQGEWEDAYEKARAFVGQLTLLEKVNLTTGTGWNSEQCVGQAGAIPRLGLRSLCMQDSPIGVRGTDYNSVFPSGQTVAATFDRGLMYARGKAMGEEHKGKGVTVQLGPVAGPLGRAPEGGRNWEGFSPDPVLTGIAIGESIKGIQDAGVIACAKHFIGNEQEHFRQVAESIPRGYDLNITQAISSNIDDTTMHELYLWPFADAVRAGVGSVMCSYNQLNNSYSCGNSYLLNHLLKNELGFQGFVMSDWQAQASGVSSALAGMDMSMPGDTLFNTGVSFWGANLTLAVLNGTVPEWRIDDMATRIMAAYFKVGLTLDEPPINFSFWTSDTYGPIHNYADEGYQQINYHVDVRGEHAAVIREIGARANVLLKNVGNALPLTTPKLIAIIGQDAGSNPLGENGCPNADCNYGTLAQGWGSGTASYANLITPQFAIESRGIQEGSVVQTILNNYADDQIASLASQASVCLVFVNADSGENFVDFDDNAGDRKNLTLWDSGDALIKNVSSLCNNTIVVMHTTGPVVVEEWYDNENVTAIIWAGLPGDQSGYSIVDTLYGDVNPAGRSPFTWGAAREDYGTDIMYQPNGYIPQQDFTEGVFIDYRAFDRANKTPIYEFGFGLSYTTFNYSGLKVEKHSVGAYTPLTGKTAAAPILGNFSTDFSDYTIPKNFTPVFNYIYPYLNGTDAASASMATDYADGDSSFILPGALDGSPQPLLPSGGAPGGHPELYDVFYTVTAQIKNTGSLNGEEVPQLYVSLGGPTDPKVVLRGFERLSIDKGDTATFTADITRRDLSNWDTVSQNWVISSYPKTVYVGSSSRILPLSATLE